MKKNSTLNFCSLLMLMYRRSFGVFSCPREFFLWRMQKSSVFPFGYYFYIIVLCAYAKMSFPYILTFNVGSLLESVRDPYHPIGKLYIYRRKKQLTFIAKRQNESVIPNKNKKPFKKVILLYNIV